MLKNFIKLTFRNLIKNKTYVIINIIGLGLSLACCIVAYLNYDFGISFDKNHKNLKNIYRIQSHKIIEGNKLSYGITPMALGSAIKGKSSAVTKQSRYEGYNLNILKGNRVLRKYIGCVEPDYLDIFTYPLKYGDKNSINEKGNIIISADLSDILFGEDVNSIGQLVKVDQKGSTVSFLVGGVMEKIPQNTSMQFQGIINLEHFFDFTDKKNNDWEYFVDASFLMIEDENKVAEVEKMLQSYTDIQNYARKDWLVNDFYLEPMETAGFTGRYIRSNGLNQAPHAMMIMVPPIMAILLLLIACFNFTNTSIAISSKRLKEIGIRKVMGSDRKQLIAQFMGENLLLCFFSLVFGILLSMWLVPAFSEMWPGIDLYFDMSRDIGLIAFIVGLLLFTAIIAGIYPSFYISGFDSVSILKGTMTVGKTSWFSYTLLTIQYFFTIIALIASVAFVRNAVYQKNMDLGFKKEAIVFVSFSKPEEGKALKNAISQYSFIESAVLTSQHVSRGTYSRTIKNQDKELETDMMELGQGYFKTMGMKIIKGRSFDKQNEDIDRVSSVIVNETLVKSFGWENPIGQRLSIGDSTRLTIVGVVKDFFNFGVWEKIEPTAIRPSAEEDANYLVVSTPANQVKKTMSTLEDAWTSIAPNKLFNGEYQDVVLKESLEVNSNIVVIFSFLGILAVILSAIGLFTLVSLNVLRRVKEIGVRKVLGAGLPHIVTLMNKVFIIVLVIATLLGAGVSVFLINELMGSIFTYYKEIDLFTVLIPVLVVTFISLSISSYRILSTAQKNPIESLRYE